MQLTKIEMATVIESALRHAKLTKSHPYVKIRARKIKDILADELELAIRAVASNDIWDMDFDEVKVHVANTLFPTLTMAEKRHIKEDAGIAMRNMTMFLGVVRWNIKKAAVDGEHPCRECVAIARKLAIIL